MLTVLMPTRNRAPIIREVLESYLALEPPEGGWHLIVIDNGSQDDTPDVVRSFANRLPISLVAEPVPGKNRALNRALPLVEGDLTVFTDDDAFPKPDWLRRYRRVAAAHPDFDLFAGVVVPRWEVPPPAWIVGWVPLGPTFTATDPGLVEGPTVPSHVYGPNFAVRSSALRGVQFDIDIGPNGKSYPMGSETALVWRLYRAGHRIWHTADNVVEHFVEASKLNRRFVLRRARLLGRGQYRIHLDRQGAPVPSIAGVPRFLLRRLLAQAGATVIARLRGDPRIAFDADWQLRTRFGAVEEAWRIARDGGRGSTSLGVAREREVGVRHP